MKRLKMTVIVLALATMLVGGVVWAFIPGVTVIGGGGPEMSEEWILAETELRSAVVIVVGSLLAFLGVATFNRVRRSANNAEHGSLVPGGHSAP